MMQDRPSRLALAHPPADAMFVEAMATIGQSLDAPVRSIPMPALAEDPPLIVHVTPLRGMARDILTSATAILVATPIVAKAAPHAELVQGLFDLAPAEARLAALIAAGHRPDEAAVKLGWTYETARTTLKRVMAKTGVSRQTEFVALFQGTLPAFGKDR